MNKKIELSISLNGKYSSSELSFLRPLSIITEYNEMATKGRYKGEISPFGLYSFTTDVYSHDLDKEIKKYCELLFNINGEITFIIYLKNGMSQCNDVIINTETMSELVKIGAKLEIVI
jgi:hypothetical protein